MSLYIPCKVLHLNMNDNLLRTDVVCCCALFRNHRDAKQDATHNPLK